MKNFKWVAAVLAVFILAGTVFYFGDGGLFKGSTDRGGKGSSTPDGGKPRATASNTTETEDESDKNVPWWCKKIEITEWSEEDEGDKGEPNSGSTPTTVVKPPEGGGGNDGGGSGSSRRPGGNGGIGRYNPATRKIEIDNPYIDDDILSEIDVPINIWLKYREIPTLSGSGAGGGRPGRDAPPKVDPKVDPKKGVQEIFYTCSCAASYFSLKELPNQKFACPEAGSTAEFYGLVDKKGKKYKVIASGSSIAVNGACEEKLKDNEQAEYYYFCGCDEENFDNEKLGKSFDCPENGEFKQYQEGNNVFVNVWKENELYCDPKWQCPEDYEWAWSKLWNNCKKIKQKECEVPDTVGDLVPGEGDKELCEASPSAKYWEDVQCSSLESCKKSMSIWKSSKNYTAEIMDKGLPWVDGCWALYGDESTGVWD